LKFITAINKETSDVIVYDNLLILVGEKGVYQYSLSPEDITNIKALSTLSL